MKIKNIWKSVKEPLELHTDERGSIVDVFYNDDIEHVAVVDSEPNVLRGNHYHKLSTQHMLMTKGSLEYWYKPTDSDEPAEMIVAKVGDIVSTPPNEIHALVIREDGNQFIVFSEGVRGGMDYESDTFRVDSIIPKDMLP
jgi:dTDP-4-dehydrorhamnose 3,5-epimerase-like enzyme